MFFSVLVTCFSCFFFSRCDFACLFLFLGCTDPCFLSPFCALFLFSLLFVSWHMWFSTSSLLLWFVHNFLFILACCMLSWLLVLCGFCFSMVTVSLCTQHSSSLWSLGQQLSLQLRVGDISSPSNALLQGHPGGCLCKRSELHLQIRTDGEVHQTKLLSPPTQLPIVYPF